MIRKLLPIVFLLAGLSAGAGVGLILGSPTHDGAPKEATRASLDPAPESDRSKHTQEKISAEIEHSVAGEAEYLKLTKQFVVPVVERDRISALVTISLSLEARPGISEKLYALEPKLRDGFLQILFDFSNKGGFDGTFTESRNLDQLKNTLLVSAKKNFGDDVSRVLITSIARQDT